MPGLKTHLTAPDAKHIALPWCHVEEFVTPDNAGSDDLYLCRATFPPGEAHLFHYHPGREEIIYVLEGQAEQWVGETKKVLKAGEKFKLKKKGPGHDDFFEPEPFYLSPAAQIYRNRHPIEPTA